MDSDGCAHWIDPSGTVKRMPPKNLGVIGNGHHIKLGRDAGENTVWDESFEQTFSKADSAFPQIIEWLCSLRQEAKFDAPRSARFVPQSASAQQCSDLAECLLSLAVRSPMNREAAVALAERFRGPLPSRERNALIGANMRNDMERGVPLIGDGGKFVAMYSPDSEFIFGDGFFHTIRSPIQSSLFNPKIFAPLTPHLAVLYVMPTSYRVEPRIQTLVVTSAETASLNEAVQVYARDKIFYRSEKPELLECFTRSTHLQYRDYRNPVDLIIDDMPGIDHPDRTMEVWFESMLQQSQNSE
jgi:hypothetical protein